MNRYELVIDPQACWGCKACEVACKQENQTPGGVKYISIQEDGPKWVDGKLDMIYQVRVCRHCDPPDCAEVCPVGAIHRREDGIVILDQERCNGCGACLEACPYRAMAFDQERGKAGKCHLCFHRVEKGLLPACADNICLAHGITLREVAV